MSDSVPLDHSNELLDVVSSNAQFRQPVLGECRLTEVVFLVAYVVKLVLYQSAKLQIGAVRAIPGIQRDQELRDAPEPFHHLLFLPTLLPCAAAKCHLLGLPEYLAHLFDVWLRGPQELHIGEFEVFVIGVVELAAFPELHRKIELLADQYDAVCRPAGRAGRPTEMEGGKRVNVYLDAGSLERAAELGNGNVSEGIRTALK